MPTTGAKRAKADNKLPWIEPIRPVRRAEAFDDPDWIYELKYDGFRALAYIEPEKPRFLSRKRNKMTRFDSLARLIAEELGGRSAILDGEIVCLDPTGRSMFKDLIEKRGAPVYYAFDLLWLDGEDLRSIPLAKRKSQLEKLIPPTSGCIGYVKHWNKRGRALFEAAKLHDLEVIVAKKKNSRYEAGTSWYKIKNKAYTQADGRHDLFDRRSNRGAA